MLVVLSVLFVGALALFCALQVATTLMVDAGPDTARDDAAEPHPLSARGDTVAP
jgi:hypothetical protein